MYQQLELLGLSYVPSGFYIFLELSRSTFTILSHPSHLVFWQRLQLARLRFGLEARNNTLEQSWWMWYGKYPSIYILIIYLLTRSLQVPTKYRCFKFSQRFFLLDEFFINTMGAVSSFRFGDLGNKCIHVNMCQVIFTVKTCNINSS